jgi:hypothetical protein
MLQNQFGTYYVDNVHSRECNREESVRREIVNRHVIFSRARSINETSGDLASCLVIRCIFLCLFPCFLPFEGRPTIVRSKLIAKHAQRSGVAFGVLRTVEDVSSEAHSELRILRCKASAVTSIGTTSNVIVCAFFSPFYFRYSLLFPHSILFC